MPRWFRRTSDQDKVVVESVRPVEIPPLTQAKRALGQGNYDEAVRVAYQTALADVQRAYRVSFPPHWTNLDVLSEGLKQMGYSGELLTQLYRLYEPVRYGPPGSSEKGDLVSLLQSLYAEQAMWRLYLQRSTPPPAAPAAPAPSGGAPS